MQISLQYYDKSCYAILCMWSEGTHSIMHLEEKLKLISVVESLFV